MISPIAAKNRPFPSCIFECKKAVSSEAKEEVLMDRLLRKDQDQKLLGFSYIQRDRLSASFVRLCFLSLRVRFSFWVQTVTLHNDTEQSTNGTSPALTQELS